MEMVVVVYDCVFVFDWLGLVNLWMCLGLVVVCGVCGVLVWLKKGVREVGEGEGK